MTMRIGIGADHAGLRLKEHLQRFLEGASEEVVDFGAFQDDLQDDYPDVVVPLAEAVARRRVDCGVAVCGSGIGAAIAANKVAGVRAARVHDAALVRRGVRQDRINLLCLGGRQVTQGEAQELLTAFLEEIGNQRRDAALSPEVENNETEGMDGLGP